MRLKSLRNDRSQIQTTRDDIKWIRGDVDRNLEIIVGKLAIAWAQLETSIDILLDAIHHRGGSQLVQSDLPVAIVNKVKYLKKARPLLSDRAANHIPIYTAEILRLKKLRSDLIHGVAGKYDLATGHWQFTRSTFSPDGKGETTEAYHINALCDGILAITALDGKISLFTLMVTDEADFSEDGKNRE